VTTASADCWRRANQRARPIIYQSRLNGTGGTYRGANKELKRGSLASRWRRAQRGANAQLNRLALERQWKSQSGLKLLLCDNAPS